MENGQDEMIVLMDISQIERQGSIPLLLNGFTDMFDIIVIEGWGEEMNFQEPCVLYFSYIWKWKE